MEIWYVGVGQRPEASEVILNERFGFNLEGHLEPCKERRQGDDATRCSFPKEYLTRG